MRNRNTIEFIGIWEQLNNPGFNSINDGMAQKNRLVKLNAIAIQQVKLLIGDHRVGRLEKGTQ